MRLSGYLTPLAAVVLALTSTITIATMQPNDMRNAAISLARMSFDLKDLIMQMNVSQHAGNMQDMYDEFDDLFDSTLSSIQLLPGSAVIPTQPDQQAVYEAYSYFVQGLFELMDALASSASTFTRLDKQSEFRVPATVRQLGGVVDAYLFNMIAVFPANTSYEAQASNQKTQVDTHIRRAVHAFHLATAQSPAPYSNVTVVE